MVRSAPGHRLASGGLAPRCKNLLRRTACNACKRVGTHSLQSSGQPFGFFKFHPIRWAASDFVLLFSWISVDSVSSLRMYFVCELLLSDELKMPGFWFGTRVASFPDRAS